ncbi:hypothetical protein O7627_25285 [Solwaraspora sp. WMMD1047]|uniref:hypothetical protein n=1 Tax=Solwaraspora sp. WMMD1047 TaxID=3016102 RepID=UPI002416951D|nr:hypothetical protein [Solwaraspora sp. WMMD1047]MDG4832599.1 hypothetical protein [Solwaraspora sp. WMMD1047]
MRPRQTRVRRVLAGLAAVLLGTGLGLGVAPAPAGAGGWASTVLDPLPERLEPQRAYTVGFWVLQHGVRPLPAEVGRQRPIGIKLVGEQGQTVVFEGVPLAEAGHFATTIVIPEAGTWRVRGAQGGFMDFEIGTVQAPGALRVLPVPAAPSPDSREWTGAVRPPQVEVDPNRNPVDTEPIAYTWNGGTPTADPAAAGEPTARSAERTGTLALVAVGLLAAVAFPALYLRRRPASG